MTADPNTPLHGVPPNALGTNLSPESGGSPVATLRSPARRGGTRRTGVELWVHRLTVLMFVFVCASIGVLLVILPWRPEWTDNYLLLGNPALRGFVASGFVRGLCSGLGLLDMWIGFWEAVHYHEDKRP